MAAPEQMSMQQLYDVIYHALALGDSTLQIWTSFTFAVIVAVHLAGDRIRRSELRAALKAQAAQIQKVSAQVQEREHPPLVTQN